MLKAANVTLAGPMRQIGSAMCNVVVQGDVAAVKAACAECSKPISTKGWYEPNPKPTPQEAAR